MAAITGEGNNQTKSFEQTIYTMEAHRSTALDVMYGLKTNVSEISGKEAPLKRNAEDNSYSALELMYGTGTGSMRLAKGMEESKLDRFQGDAPLALELMYSRIS